MDVAAILFIFVLITSGLLFLQKKYDNPYKLTFIFGKKGSGKSCYMVREMLRYKRLGYLIYTDMQNVRINGVRIINVKDLALFRPEPHSAIFLDEVGISMDNRNFKSFPPGLRDFFKYARKMQCVVFMNSQAFDVDKKVRDTTDRMVLQVALFGCLSLSRPIHRSITLVDASAAGDSRIADNLRFGSVFSWRLYWMPHYFRFFDSLEMPNRDTIPYHEIIGKYEPPITVKESLQHVFRSAQSYFRRRSSIRDDDVI